MKIGIITADPSLASRLRRDLAELGFSAIEEGVAHEAPTVILLDCRSSAPKAQDHTDTHDVPVIAIIEDRADMPLDYLAKVAGVLFYPCSPDALQEELFVRVSLAVSENGAPSTDDAFEWGGFRIDFTSYEVTIDGQKLELTYKEFELLKCLVSSPGRVFTRSQLLKIVWGYDYIDGARTVDVHIRRLRSKLGAQYAPIVETVRHVGYRLTSDAARAVKPK